MLSDFKLEQARELAELIRSKVEASECYAEKFIVKITMSFGVAPIKENELITSNVKVADDNLYTAKQQGRNRVIG